MSKHPIAHGRLRNVGTIFGVRGLRGRLIVVFVVVAMLGASASAWAGAQQAARSLTDSSQQQHAETLIGQVSAIAPSAQFPPGQDALDQLRAAVGENALVIYEDAYSASGVFAADAGASSPVEPMAELPSAELRSAVNVDDDAGGESEGRIFSERVVVEDTVWLVIGAPVMITAPDGSRSPSGVEVYSAQDLSGIEHEIGTLTRAAVGTSALVLPVAVVLALLASRTVLAPVRRLGTTARRLADGDLSARTEPRGVDELAHLTRTVNEMAESLQESMVSMARMQEDAKRFAADVSHELRTPLTTLTAAVEILNDALQHKDTHTEGRDHDEAGTRLSRAHGDAGVSDAEATAERERSDARESARLAIMETRRLVRLVEDIMEIARFDVGTAPVRREPTDLAALARECIQARGWSGAVTILRAGEAREDLTVLADRRRLDVVLANLIGNALKHGGAPVQTKFFARPDRVSVEVTDSGPGIPEEVLPRIFDRFYKADAARARTSGSGLGLAIALENAKLHGGDITAENAPEGGARFTLWLPRHDGGDDDAGRHSDGQEAGEGR